MRGDKDPASWLALAVEDGLRNIDPLDMKLLTAIGNITPSSLATPARPSVLLNLLLGCGQFGLQLLLCSFLHLAFYLGLRWGYISRRPHGAYGLASFIAGHLWLAWLNLVLMVLVLRAVTALL